MSTRLERLKAAQAKNATRILAMDPEDPRRAAKVARNAELQASIDRLNAGEEEVEIVGPVGVRIGVPSRG